MIRTRIEAMAAVYLECDEYKYTRMRLKGDRKTHFLNVIRTRDTYTEYNLRVRHYIDPKVKRCLPVNEIYIFFLSECRERKYTYLI